MAFSADAAALAGSEQAVTVRIADLPGETKYGASVFGRLGQYPVVFYGDETALTLRPGDVVTCTAEIKTADRTDDTDTLFFRSRGARFLLFAQSELSVAHEKPTVPEKLRIWLRDRIDGLYEGEEAGFLLAILTGDRSRLPFHVRNDLSVSGLSHAIAVSGMHISMLMLLVSSLCGRNPRLTAILGIPIVVIFALMTGASASVCRAAFMHVLLLLAPTLGREHDGPTALAGAALMLLLIDPWIVADVSFQLSFAAVAGLIWISGPIQKKLLSLQKMPGRALRIFASGVSATLSATIATVPLTVIYFRQLSLVSVAVNLLSLWSITGIFVLGLTSCVLGRAGAVLAWPVKLLTKYVLTLSGVAARVPYAAASVYNPALLAWACAAYLVVICLLLCRRKRSALLPMSFLTVTFLAALLFGRWQLCRNNMTFTALDVGQGQCLVLRSGDFTAVIDCGGSYPDEAGEEAARLLHSAGITQVDALIVTHYDEDHSGGIPQLLQRVRVDQILVPEYPSEYAKELEFSAAEAKASVTPVREQALIEFDNGHLHLMAAKPGTEGNDAGLCVLAKAGEYDILVTGDRSGAGELAMLSAWAVPDVDLLVAGHHGAASSTSKLLLEHTKPETVVISAGTGNPYGHPAPEVLERIVQVGAQVLRTDVDGTIILTD